MTSLRSLAVVFLAVACSTVLASAAQPLPNGGRPAEKTAFPAIVDWNSLSIGLERSACAWRSCPAYSVTVSGDGTVTYRGRAFVALTGTHVAHIPPEAVHRLFDAFAKAEFFWTLDRYKGSMTEQAAFVVTLAFDGHKKSVIDYLGKSVGMPAEITALEEAIDAAAGTDRWVKGSEDLFAVLKSQNWDFSATDDDHVGLLATAAERGDEVLVGKLLTAGVPTKTRFGCQAVAAAASKPNMFMLKVLLAAGAPVQWTAPAGEELKNCSALIAAAGSGRPDIVQALLAHRPNIDAQDPTGTTALMRAVDFSGRRKAETDYIGVIGTLLAAGANPRLIDKYGRTALDIANGSGVDGDVAQMLKSWMDAHPKAG